MKCPYCNGEVEWGNLETEGSIGLFYLPAGAKQGRYTTRNVQNKGGVVLDGPHLTRLNRTKVQCCICKKCRKIIISYN